MVDARRILVEICKKNKKKIAREINNLRADGKISSDDLEAAMQLPTTHTFPKYKNLWQETIDVRKKVLIDGQGLLAETEREGEDTRFHRLMPKARSVNLHYYVFSYHGIHDPYYANYPKEPMCKPFGVFIDPEIEKISQTEKPPLPSIATYRDLESPEARVPIEDNFLLSEDARKLLALEIKKKYNSFWHYWGTPDTYSDRHWEHLYEFHFLKEVPVERLLAIIWPVDIVFHEVTGEEFKDTDEIDKIKRFKGNYPDVCVYHYEWHPRYAWKAVIRFQNQSYMLAMCYLKKKSFFDNTDCLERVQ